MEAEDKYAPAVSGGLLSVLVTLGPQKIGRVGAIHVCAHVCTCEDRSPSSTPQHYCYLRSQIPHQLFGEAYLTPWAMSSRLDLYSKELAIFLLST